MNFERAWVLLLIVLPLAWAAFETRRRGASAGVWLKCATFILILLALAEPVLTVPETKSAVAVLVDTSISSSPEDLTTATQYAKRVVSNSGRNYAQVIPFARTILSTDQTTTRTWTLQPAKGEAGRGTDIEGAIRAGLASLPSGAVPKVVLVSDGRENEGSAARGAWLARQLGVPVDTVPLAGRTAPKLHIESISFPVVAFTGERFPIELVLTSPRSGRATVQLTAEGKKIGASDVTLSPGSNQLRVQASLNVAGAVDISGVITTPDLGEARFEQAITLRRPKILYVSLDPAGTEGNILETLREGQFDVNNVPDLLNDLSEYQLVVLNNQDFEHIAPARKTALEDYVRSGGGLLIIGGERNVFVDDKKTEDALDRVLPAKLAPPRSPEGTCVILIIDKSSSMEGRKMELARLSAIGVIDNLRPIDTIGVLIFDNSFQWTVPLRKAEDRNTIKRLVSGIMPDGGTQIAPALAEAYRRIVPVNATYKHIVLLTDGISEEGDSLQVSRDASERKVTISTVGLGQDVNRAYLEKVAVNAKGKSYFLVDPSGLEQILLKDVMEHTGSTAVEKPVKPVISKKTSVLEGIKPESLPDLLGYVRFISKPGAETSMTVEKDPLFVSWQYGLGRAAVWASDAKSRWAERWINWNGYDRFWLNVMRDLLPQAQAGEASTHFDGVTGNLVIEYRLAPNTAPATKVPQIYALGPENFRKPVVLRRVATGSYRGEVNIGSLQGLFRIRPLEDSRAFPETGFYREEEELRDYGNNEPLLKEIAQYTGGKYRPDPSSVFDTGGRSLPSTLRLWPLLLAIAVVLNFAEVIVRKWRLIQPYLDRVTGRRVAL